jgi:hypothetical protein
MGYLVREVNISCYCIRKLIAKLVISWRLCGGVAVASYPFQVGVGDMEGCEVWGLVVSVDAVSGVVFMYGRELGDYGFAIGNDCVGPLYGECGC